MKKIISILFTIISINAFADIKISGTLSDVTTGPSTSQGTITISCKGRGECGTIKKTSNTSGTAEFRAEDRSIIITFETLEITEYNESTDIIFYLPN